MQGGGFEHMNYLKNIPRWGTGLLLIVCGVCVGVILSLWLLCGTGEHEVVVSNFLGYEQLMIIKKL